MDGNREKNPHNGDPIKTCKYRNTAYEIVAEHGNSYVLKALSRKKVDGSGEYDDVVFADKEEVMDVKFNKVQHVGVEQLNDDIIYKMMFNFCKVFLHNENLMMGLSASDRAFKIPVLDTGYDMNMYLSITKREENE